jgi:hypothetical protein
MHRGTYTPRGYGGFTSQSQRGYTPRGRGESRGQGDQEGYASRGRGDYTPRGERGGYTPRGDRGGYTSRGSRGDYTPRGARGGYSPRGARGGYTPRGARGDYIQREGSQSEEREEREEEGEGDNQPRYENDEVRPERYYEQKTHYTPYRKIGPARKHPLPPPTKMDVPEVVKEAHQGFDEEQYPPPDPNKRKNKDKYDPEKRKLLKKTIRERKTNVNTKKEVRKAVRDEKKAIKNEERKEKLQHQKEAVQQYIQEHGADDDFVRRRREILGPIEDLKKELEKKPDEAKKVVMIGKNPIRNQKFIKNARCPITGKFIKEIWRKKITKIGREKWDLVWQYYRDRNRESVLSKLKKLEDLEIEIVYFGEDAPKRFIVPKIDAEEELPDTRASKKAKLIKLRKILYNLEVRMAGTKGYISPPDKLKLENRIQFMKDKIAKFQAQIEKLNQMYGHQTEYDQEVIKKLLDGVPVVKSDEIRYTNNKSEIVRVGDEEKKEGEKNEIVKEERKEDDEKISMDEDDEAISMDENKDDEAISMDGNDDTEDDEDSKFSTEDTEKKDAGEDNDSKFSTEDLTTKKK